MTEDIKTIPSFAGHRKRLKTRILKNSGKEFHDYELLELILFSGSPRKDTKPLAKELIANYKTLGKILSADIEELDKFNGLGESNICFLKAIKEITNRVSLETLNNKICFENINAIIVYLRNLIGLSRIEKFAILYLDNKNNLIKTDILQEGTINEVMAYPKEIIRRSLLNNAASIVISHNHTSGDPTPSESDIKFTKQLNLACKIMDIKLQAHIIVTENTYNLVGSGEI